LLLISITENKNEWVCVNMDRFRWRKLFNEALEKIRDGSWQIGEVVEVIQLWVDLTDTHDFTDTGQLRYGHKRYTTTKPRPQVKTGEKE